MDVSSIFYLILGICSLIITGLIIPVAVKHIGKENLATIMEIVRIGVLAAEQLEPIIGKGRNKKVWVKKFVKSKNIKITDEELDACIEAAVKELNLWQGEIKEAIN